LNDFWLGGSENDHLDDDDGVTGIEKIVDGSDEW